eukprot:CAMPEP_0117475320 /NCGR_PEP_ID=MMETSP0784-20121206/9734_1 /TAXON_ID=39447 /ORGANISM="" /LENGTH=159 /DNA_ID=CAMNT_0005269563 /DNA_START=45 /DNA_END=524 /DNA_ORIENTATION=+
MAQDSGIEPRLDPSHFSQEAFPDSTIELTVRSCNFIDPLEHCGVVSLQRNPFLSTIHKLGVQTRAAVASAPLGQRVRHLCDQNAYGFLVGFLQSDKECRVHAAVCHCAADMVCVQQAHAVGIARTRKKDALQGYRIVALHAHKRSELGGLTPAAVVLTP